MKGQAFLLGAGAVSEGVGGEDVFGGAQVEVAKEGVSFGIQVGELGVAAGDTAFFIDEGAKGGAGRMLEGDFGGKSLVEAGEEAALAKFHIAAGFDAWVERSDEVDDGATDNQCTGRGIMAPGQVTVDGEAVEGVVESTEGASLGGDFDVAGQVIDRGGVEALAQCREVMGRRRHIGVDESQYIACGVAKAAISCGVRALNFAFLKGL